jgi:hypothetical protein
MRVPWKIIGLAGVAGVTAATGVVVARNRRDHTEYDPDELRDRLHSRVADAAEEDDATAEAETSVDGPASWQAAAEADTAVHTAPHGDPAAEVPADEPAE